MERPGDSVNCPTCGDPLADGKCRSCRSTPNAIDLKVLRGAGRAQALQAASEVRLVRQLKLPTVDQLLAGRERSLDRLPGRVRAMQQAVEAGDLEAADQLMDRTLGSLLSGPGYQESTMTWAFLPLLLWVWCGILFGLFILSCL